MRKQAREAGRTTPSLRDYASDRMQPGDRLFGVVDAARDGGLARAARNRCGLETATLFGGPLAPFLDHVAPQLVTIALQSEFLEVWSQHLGRSAGILLVSNQPSRVLWSHLRHLFHVADEDDAEYAFRYYDPRVLRVYLPTCTPHEATEFFGPVRQILVESEREGVMLSCSLGRAGVLITEGLVGAAATPAPAKGTPR